MDSHQSSTSSTASGGASNQKKGKKKSQKPPPPPVIINCFTIGMCGEAAIGTESLRLIQQKNQGLPCVIMVLHPPTDTDAEFQTQVNQIGPIFLYHGPLTQFWPVTSAVIVSHGISVKVSDTDAVPSSCVVDTSWILHDDKQPKFILFQANSMLFSGIPPAFPLLEVVRLPVLPFICRVCATDNHPTWVHPPPSTTALDVTYVLWNNDGSPRTDGFDMTDLIERAHMVICEDSYFEKTTGTHHRMANMGISNQLAQQLIQGHDEMLLTSSPETKIYHMTLSLDAASIDPACTVM